ncbi:hypothetical protein ccbrp13_05150 [Ktedonobacteria bacterium brp13]|nr:hypothetical protein ccbrp13_05150 [Ktedonobacteria bacterium brp13]
MSSFQVIDIYMYNTFITVIYRSTIVSRHDHGEIALYASWTDLSRLDAQEHIQSMLHREKNRSFVKLDWQNPSLK